MEKEKLTYQDLVDNIVSIPRDEKDTLKTFEEWEKKELSKIARNQENKINV